MLIKDNLFKQAETTVLKFLIEHFLISLKDDDVVVSLFTYSYKTVTITLELFNKILKISVQNILSFKIYFYIGIVRILRCLDHSRENIFFTSRLKLCK